MFVHVEAPDEAGHHGDYEEKIEAIENFDEKVVGTVLDGIKVFDDYRIMAISDHLTPVRKRTHTDDPTPFAWATKNELEAPSDGPGFSETSARESGLFFENGHELMTAFLSRT
jgi:2,3-bisphosphoglycerate-independent phosphoglycerate mutase